MRCQQSSRCTAGVRPKTRPFEGSCIRAHSSANRIGFDVPHASKKIAIASDRSGAEAPFVQGTRAPSATVYVGRVTTRGGMHQAGKRFWLPRRDQQVDMVRHEDVRVQVASLRPHCLSHVLQEDPAIHVFEETRLAVMPADDDVLWYAGDIDAMDARHDNTTRLTRRQPTSEKYLVLFGSMAAKMYLVLFGAEMKNAPQGAFVSSRVKVRTPSTPGSWSLRRSTPWPPRCRRWRWHRPRCASSRSRCCRRPSARRAAWRTCRGCRPSTPRRCR